MGKEKSEGSPMGKVAEGFEEGQAGYFIGSGIHDEDCVRMHLPKAKSWQSLQLLVFASNLIINEC